MKFRSKGLRGTPSVRMLRAGRTAIASSTQKGLRPRPMNIRPKLTATAERATIRISTRGSAWIGSAWAATGSGSAGTDAILARELQGIDATVEGERCAHRPHHAAAAIEPQPRAQVVHGLQPGAVRAEEVGDPERAQAVGGPVQPR